MQVYDIYIAVAGFKRVAWAYIVVDVSTGLVVRECTAAAIYQTAKHALVDASTCAINAVALLSGVVRVLRGTHRRIVASCQCTCVRVRKSKATRYVQSLASDALYGHVFTA
jgi:hypothetical protein